MKYSLRISSLFLAALAFYVFFGYSYGFVENELPGSLDAKQFNFNRHKDLQRSIISNFCSLLLPSSIPGFSVSFGGIRAIHSPQFALNYSVYSSSDIVSDNVARGGWETKYVTNAIKALKKVASSKTNPNPIFLDIGANVGFFTLSVAASGFDVIAFEPMRENALLIKKTICDNPVLDQKITLFNKGLGTEEETCWIYSGSSNTGDGHVKCKEKPKTKYVIRGLIETVRLDDYIDDPKVRSQIAVVKMDVEGYEHNVLRGGMQVLLSSRIPYIMTEFSRNMMPAKGGNCLEFLKSFYDAGYTAKKDFFSNGPGYTQDEVINSGLNELFFVYKSVKNTDDSNAYSSPIGWESSFQ